MPRTGSSETCGSPASPGKVRLRGHRVTKLHRRAELNSGLSRRGAGSKSLCSRAFQDGSLCYFSIKENKRLVLLDGIKISGAKACELIDGHPSVVAWPAPSQATIGRNCLVYPAPSVVGQLSALTMQCHHKAQTLEGALL